MERIAVKTWQEAKQYKDHTDRYELAASFLKPKSLILDAACGVGYGTAFLAARPEVEKAFGVDVSFEAIVHATNHHSSNKTEFQRKNLDDGRTLFNLQFDMIVCFETLEHLINDRRFLENIYAILKSDGRFFVSVPNEIMFPFGTTANPFHYRHYTYEEIHSLLNQTGFFIEGYYTQTYTEHSSEITKGQSALSNLFFCRKVV